MVLDFTEIKSGESFELFCAALFRALGCDVVRPPGPGSDRGVDMVIRFPNPVLGASGLFLVQCKHFASSRRAVGLNHLHGIPIVDLVKTYNAHGYILIASTTASSSLQEQFSLLYKNTGHQIIIWDKSVLEEKLAAANDPRLVAKYFPSSGLLLRDSMLLPPNLAQWDTILETLYARAIKDIDENIGTKYIAELYVNRAQVENQVASFALAATPSGHLTSLIKTMNALVASTISPTPVLFSRSSLNIRRKISPNNLGWIGAVELLQTLRKYWTAGKSHKELILASLDELKRRISELQCAFNPNENSYAPTRPGLTTVLSLISTRISETINQVQTMRNSATKIVHQALNNREQMRSETDHVKRTEIFRTLETVTASAEKSIREFDSMVGNLSKLRQTAEQVQNELNPAVALVDRAGRGKTNLVCDLVKQRLGRHQPVFFVAAKSLAHGLDNPINQGIVERTQGLSGFGHEDPLPILAQLSYLNNTTVLIIVDGINENLNPLSFAAVLHSFLAGLKHVNIRVVITCREEYWAIFHNIAGHVGKILRGRLGLFSSSERDHAISKYFSHYQIRAKIDREPLEALQDPLLLRFFCEAYGSRPDSADTHVKHIRLKALFDEYQAVKYGQIAAQVRDIRSPNSVSDYVSRIARALIDFCVTSLRREHLNGAIPAEDLNNVGSLYYRLLDEDIILEQRYHGKAGGFTVNFTYEAFMEYTLGGILDSDYEIDPGPALLFLTSWLAKNRQFPNLAGVLGFYLTFLFERNRDDFHEVLEWLSETKREEHSYALRIALDNLPPEEFSQSIFSALIKRLALSRDPKEGLSLIPWRQGKAKSSERAFDPMEALRLLLRCPPDLAPRFIQALEVIEPNIGADPLLWATVFAHFGESSTELMLQSIGLRFQMRKPLHSLTIATVRRLQQWCDQHSGVLDTMSAQQIIRRVVARWEQIRQEIDGGYWGGWNGRTSAVDRLVVSLETHLIGTREEMQ